MSNQGEVISVNTSRAKGTIKRPVAEVTIDAQGMVDDAHAGNWHRQVSLLGRASIDRFAAKLGRAIEPGEFAENITIGGLDVASAAIFDRYTVGEAELEVTQIGKTCHGDDCAIYREVGKCVMPKEGIFCRVLRGGAVRRGDAVVYEPRVLRFLLITLSDRAHRGIYEDRSGPRAKELVEAFLAGTRWQATIETVLLPDDAEQLGAQVIAARARGVDVILTLGGTGVGPRDITPETVAPLCDKLIPGIMEAIRIKFGAEKPRALLSRGIAGIAGQTLIYTLPGSVRAVEEYLQEILLTLEHLIYMVHGLDVH